MMRSSPTVAVGTAQLSLMCLSPVLLKAGATATVWSSANRSLIPESAIVARLIFSLLGVTRHVAVIDIFGAEVAIIITNVAASLVRHQHTIAGPGANTV